MNFQRSRAFLYLSLLSIFNSIIFVSSILKENQGNEVKTEGALNKASKARLMPFVFNPTIAQALRQHWGRC